MIETGRPNSCWDGVRVFDGVGWNRVKWLGPGVAPDSWSARQRMLRASCPVGVMQQQQPGCPHAASWGR